MQAVAKLQEKKLIHRDIKPGNIMLKYNDGRDLELNEIKLIDFGLASQVHKSGYNLFSICGTPGFIAPEIASLCHETIEATPADTFFNCDMFAIGALFYLLLTEELPFTGYSFDDVLANNKKAKINWDNIRLQFADPLAMDLLSQLLQVNQTIRPKAATILDHPYLKGKDTQEPNKVSSEEVTEDSTIKEIIAGDLCSFGLEKKTLINHIDELLFDNQTDVLDNSDEAPLNSPSCKLAP